MRATPPLVGSAGHARSRHRRLAAFVFLIVEFAVFVVAGAPRPAVADAISAKRKEAARLNTAIESLSARIDVLDEDALNAQLQLARLRKLEARRSKDVTAAASSLQRLRSSARSQALTDYAQPASVSVVDMTDASSLGDLERRSIYRNRSRESNRSAIDALSSSTADLRVRQAEADRARRNVLAVSASLDRKRRETDALVTKFQALQKQATGDLARLIAEEQARQAAAEERRARAALAARAAAASKELARRYDQALRAAKAARGSRRGQSSIGPASATLDRRSQQLAVDAGLTAELPASPGAASAVRYAMSQLGKPYVWGAAGPGSFDCSGLMLFAWAAAGRSLPHSSRSQYASTTRVPVSQIKPGDLVFFGSPIHHVGMYVGNGQMVEAPHRGASVKTAPIFRSGLVGVGRVG